MEQKNQKSKIFNLNQLNRMMALHKLCPQWVGKTQSLEDENCLFILPSNLLPFLLFIRDHMGCEFKTLVELCGVDYIAKEQRFRVLYVLRSVNNNASIKVAVDLDDLQGVDSVTSLFNSAIWPERETWDLLGIFFHGHPDLRRILTDYGFEGHPLRKDFPLTGYTEVSYDDTDKRVVYLPVQLCQEFRSFDLISPWNTDRLNA